MEDSQDALVVEKKEGGDFDDNMASEESDDDLLSPPMFLYEPRRLSQIQTPVKVLTPANSDLSPIRPSDEIEQKKKRKLCFSKLVQERAEQDENDKKLSKMNKELKEGLDNGGIFNMIMHEDSSQTDGDLSDESQDMSDLLPQQRKELDKNIQKMNEGFENDFQDGYPGEVLFVYQPSSLNLQTPTFITELMGVSIARSSPLHETDPLTDEFLLSGFLVDLSVLKKNIDPCVMDWLLRCMCFSSKFEVIEAAYKAAWALFTSSNMELEWKFTTDGFLRLLVGMGVGEERLYISNIGQDLYHFKRDFDHGPLRPLDQGLSTLFLHRLQTLLKLFSSYLMKNPQLFSNLDIMLNVLLGLRVGIALEVSACIWECEVYIGCAIDLYSDEDWGEEAPKICKNALALTSNHSSRLQLVEIVPGTSRGRELKKLLALTMLTCIVSYNDFDICDYGKLLRNSDVSIVLDVVSRIRTNQETDFHELFSTISFINHCTPEESITATDKKKLESLISALRRLNGDIRDPGGYYLNRTKVKDLIIRTLNRLMYICNGLQTQSKLDGFFGEKTSNFDELKFETLQDEPDRVGMPEEENLEDLDIQDVSNEQMSGVRSSNNDDNDGDDCGGCGSDCGDDGDDDNDGDIDDDDDVNDDEDGSGHDDHGR